MPKKKTNQLAVRERNFNEAGEVLNTTIQSLSSTSLLPYLSTHSPTSYFFNAGFQVYNNLADPGFQTVLLSWMPALVHDLDSLSQPYFLLNEGCPTAYGPVAPTQAVMAATPTALLPYTHNQAISKFPTLLQEEVSIPCEMSLEFEDNNSFQTMILKAPFRPTLPFGEKQYDFPYFSDKKSELLSGPITTVDPFVVQHYKCAMEWFQLLRSCSFPRALSNKDIANLVTYQVTYDSLLQTINVLQLYLSANQNDVKQEVFVCIENNRDKFSDLDKPRDLFRRDPIEIKKQLENLENLSRDFSCLLMLQGLLQTIHQGIDSFHRVSPDLILYVQNGPFSGPETCSFTGLLSWLHALTVLPDIAELVQYTVETSEQTGRFLKQEYAAKMLQIAPSKKTALPHSRGISASFIREKLDECAKSGDNLYQLPHLEEKVLLVINRQAVSSLVLNIKTDIAEQLFNYLVNSSTSFASPFALYSSPTLQLALSLGTIFNRLAALTNHCVEQVVIPIMMFETTGSLETKRLPDSNLHSLEIIIDGHIFLVYPDYLLGDNYFLIRQALCTRLKILILDHLTQDAKKYGIYPTVSQSFYPLLKSYFQHYFTLMIAVETCTRQERQKFMAQHNAERINKAAQVEKELFKQLEQEEEKKNQGCHKSKQQTKILPLQESREVCMLPEISVAESLKVEAPTPFEEDILEKQLVQLQSEINRITGNNRLSTLSLTQKKINYLVSCIDSFKALLAAKEEELRINKKNIDMLRAVLRVEIFYHLGLLLPYQATRFSNESNIDNFNSVLTTLKTLQKELEDVNSLYASILAEQDSMPENDPRMKKLKMLTASIILTVDQIKKNIKRVEDSLQQVFDASQHGPHIPRSRLVFLKPLYIAVPNYKTLVSCFSPERARRDLNKVRGEFLDSSTRICNELTKKNRMESNNPSPCPQVCLFSSQPARNKAGSTSENSSLDDTQPTSAFAVSRSLDLLHN
jgi:hypothetical protein